MRWIQNPEPPFNLIPADSFVPTQNMSAVIHGDVQAFVSPIDKTVIDDRGKLRRHNAKHGVTDSRDYSTAFMKKRSQQRIDQMNGNTPQARQERIHSIRESIERLS